MKKKKIKEKRKTSFSFCEWDIMRESGIFVWNSGILYGAVYCEMDYFMLSFVLNLSFMLEYIQSNAFNFTAE